MHLFLPSYQICSVYVVIQHFGSLVAVCSLIYMVAEKVAFWFIKVHSGFVFPIAFPITRSHAVARALCMSTQHYSSCRRSCWCAIHVDVSGRAMQCEYVFRLYAGAMAARTLRLQKAKADLVIKLDETMQEVRAQVREHFDLLACKSSNSCMELCAKQNRQI